MPEHDKIRTDFIEKVGQIAQGDGMPRIAGRVFGLLMFDGKPVSFGDLATELQVSRGSISSSVRMLEDRGAIKRVGLPGERQDHFQLADQPYRGALEGALKRSERAADDIGGTIDDLGGDRTGTRERLRDYRNFYLRLAVALRQAMDTPEPADKC